MPKPTAKDLQMAEAQAKQNSAKSAPAETASLSVMLGLPGELKIGGGVYPLIKFSLSMQGLAGIHFAQIPRSFLIHAAAAADSDDGQYSFERTAQKLNHLKKAALAIARKDSEAAKALEESPELTAELVEKEYYESLLMLQPEEADAMASVISIAVSTEKNPVDPKEIAAMDPEETLDALRAIFIMNPLLRKSF